MGSRLLVCGDLLIDGTGRPPLEDGAVAIEDGKIVAVDTLRRLQSVWDGASMLDYRGSVLIPGMIDCHNHLSLDCSLDNYLAKMNDRESELTLRAVTTMATDLRSGVTTSRCMGDRFFIDAVCKRAVEEGTAFGPRLVVATRGIRASHGHGFVGLPFDGVEIIRSAVRENLKAGADLIKIYMTGTVRNKLEIQHYLSFEEIKVVVDEAKRAGVKTAAHCIGGRGFELCIQAGIDSIEHGYYLTDSEITMLSNSSAWLVLTPSEFLTEKLTLSQDKVEAIRRERPVVKARMAAIITSGVEYAVGTDGSHGALAKELEYIVEAGAKPSEALKAATINGAKVCGLADRIGSLEVGKYADIVVVDGNPLENVRALSRIKAVIKEGRVVVTT